MMKHKYTFAAFTAFALANVVLPATVTIDGGADSA